MLALLLPGLTVAVSFALDLSQMYVAQRHNQLVSDMADLAAANTPSPVNGTTPSPMAIATALNLVAINGLGAANTTTDVVLSPIHTGVYALRTTVIYSLPLNLGMMSVGRMQTIGVSSLVEPVVAGICFRSLIGPTNIYNTAVVYAPGCLVEAKTYLYSCGTSVTTMTAATVGYTSAWEAAYLCGTARMIPAAGGFTYSATVTDTIATTTPVTGMKAHLNGMAGGWPFGTTSPVNPAIPSGSVNPTYTNLSATLLPSIRYGSITATNANLAFVGNGLADPSCTNPTTIAATLSLSGTNTFTFNSGCYTFGAAVYANTASVTRFVTAPGASVVFVFKGTLTLAANAELAFGDSTTFFNGGSIANNAGSKLTFGNGPFYLWGGTLYNYAANSVLTLGNGPFYFYGGSISNTGRMTLGNGPFYFSGGSVALNAGSTSSFGVGNMDFYGGTVIAGGQSVTFGAGGSASSGSGAVSMYGGSFALTANTLNAVGTSFGFSGGSVSLTGIGTINATAPTDPTPALGYRNLLFGIWGGAFSLYQSSGQVDTMSGVLYVPSSNASIYGSQTIRMPSGGCFGVMSGVLDIYQSTKINGAPCAGLTKGSTSTRGVLIQ